MTHLTQFTQGISMRYCALFTQRSANIAERSKWGANFVFKLQFRRPWHLVQGGNVCFAFSPSREGIIFVLLPRLAFGTSCLHSKYEIWLTAIVVFSNSHAVVQDSKLLQCISQVNKLASCSFIHLILSFLRRFKCGRRKRKQRRRRPRRERWQTEKDA